MRVFAEMNRWGSITTSISRKWQRLLSDNP
jgi:hypothetical protein